MTPSAKGDKAIHVLKFIAHDGNPVHLITDMVYLQRISCTADTALVTVTQPNLTANLLPIGIV